jgi:hypothetical protein
LGLAPITVEAGDKSGLSNILCLIWHSTL